MRMKYGILPERSLTYNKRFAHNTLAKFTNPTYEFCFFVYILCILSLEQSSYR